MSFISLQYAIFFPAVCLIYFVLAPAYRWIPLLLASCVFYMAFIPKYILVLFLLIAVDYGAGIVIARSEGKRRWRALLASIAANIGILCAFKYVDFFSSNVATALNALGLAVEPVKLGWILPLGISFHTFQSLSYTIEVYWGKQAPEKHLGYYALYVLFFPQLVAGPIERPQNLLPQLRNPPPFDAARVASGLRLILLGFIKKVVVADRLGSYVDQVYGSVHAYPGPALLVATVYFAFQIFCDFSAYTDIARGSARVLGIDLMQNFEQPYLSRSITEFWRRWHISLTSWFRDYLFKPLVRTRWGGEHSLALKMGVFLISGLWHGANWTFVIWGAIHGFYLACSSLLAGFRARIWSITRLDRFPPLLQAIQIFVTFALVLVAWVFFRAKSVDDAFYVLRTIVSDHWWRLSEDQVAAAMPDTHSLKILGTLIVGMLGFQIWQRVSDVESWILLRPRLLRWAAYYSGLALILFLGVQRSRQFIYFQF